MSILEFLYKKKQEAKEKKEAILASLHNNPQKINNKAISWDEYFIGIAKLSSMRSKDPVTKVGAVIVNKEKKIIGVGYNGLPNGCNDKDFPWHSKNNPLPWKNKYQYVVHAELNAILNSITDLKNSSIYCTLYPCSECAKAIIQKGIKKVYYIDKPSEPDKIDATDLMFKKAKVKTIKVEAEGEQYEK